MPTPPPPPRPPQRSTPPPPPTPVATGPVRRSASALANRHRSQATQRGAKPRRSIRPLVAIGLVAVLGVVGAAGSTGPAIGRTPCHHCPEQGQFDGRGDPRRRGHQISPRVRRGLPLRVRTDARRTRSHPRCGGPRPHGDDRRRTPGTDPAPRATVYGREDLWAATDPLVLEYAENIADDLRSILDGTEVDFEYLDGDVDLFRSLCQDWFAPNLSAGARSEGMSVAQRTLCQPLMKVVVVQVLLL